jgi:hypothetical protein
MKVFDAMSKRMVWSKAGMLQNYRISDRVKGGAANLRRAMAKDP